MRNLINRAAAAATFTVWNTKRQAKEALCNERGIFTFQMASKSLLQSYWVHCSWQRSPEFSMTRLFHGSRMKSRHYLVNRGSEHNQDSKEVILWLKS